MRKTFVLTILVILILINSTIAANYRTITINEVPIDYILINNEPYISYHEMEKLSFNGSCFSEANRQQVNGVFYLRLKDVCNNLGIISTEKTDSYLKITLNLTKLIFSAWTNEIKFSGYITVHVTSSNGFNHTISIEPAKKEILYFPAGTLTFKTDEYETTVTTSDFNHATGGYDQNKTKTGFVFWEKTMTVKGGETTEVLLNDDCMRWVKK